jgi:hypothetical protein
VNAAKNILGMLQNDSLASSKTNRQAFDLLRAPRANGNANATLFGL